MLQLLVVILLLHSSDGTSTSSVLFKEVTAYHNETYYKADHAYQVVSKIYNAFRQWFFTITFCEFTYFENRILRYTETSGYGYPVVLLNGCPDNNRSRVTPRINIHGQTAYVITAGAISIEGSEYVVEALIRTGVFKPRSAVIFILNEDVEMDNYFFYTMKIHFQYLWVKSITNSVVMLLWEGVLRTFTYISFNDQILDITNVRDISNFLSYQYDNLLGHELKVSVYRKITAYDDNSPIKCDSRLAETIMQRLNATCKPLAPRDGNTIGDLLSNGTATGVTADLIDGYTDLELTSRILKMSYYGYIDTTYPLMHDELCFMVKGAERQSTFMTTIKLISLTILVMFMCLVVILISVTLIARNLETNIWNIRDRTTTGSMIMDLIKCFIRQTVDVKIGGPVFRFLVLMIIMYSLIVDCVIDGILTSAITYPRYVSEVNTLDGIMNGNLTIGIHNRHIRMFIRSLGDNNTYDKIKHRIEIINDRKIKTIIENREYQYAMLLRKSDALEIIRKPKNMKNGRPLFQVVQECPIPCFIVFGLRYGCPYKPKVEKILHHLNQGGITNYWQKSEEFKIIQSLYNPDTKNLKSLNLGNLHEVFAVWFIGLALSAFIFLLELLAHWFGKVHTVLLFVS